MKQQIKKYLCVINKDCKLLVVGDTYFSKTSFISLEKTPYIFIDVTDDLSMPVKLNNFIEDPEHECGKGS